MTKVVVVAVALPVRVWARKLGISHTWLQKLVREFQADPSDVAATESPW